MLKLVYVISLYYDERSKEHQISENIYTVLERKAVITQALIDPNNTIADQYI